LWPLAGVLGMLVTALLAVTDQFSQRSTAVELFLAVLLGVMTMIAFAPWKAILGGSRVRREVRHLTHQLRRAGHNEPLRGMLTGGDDDFGRLRRAIYNRLSEATAHRLEAGHLRRTMDDSIRRETGRATDRLQKEVDTDALTGVGNRRAMRKHLEAMLSEPAGEPGQPLVALVIDVDRFKPINDRLGHAVGDECLIFLGKILAGSLRGNDRAFRCGGDEFVILMSGANADIGIRLGRRICDLYRQMTWSHKAAVRPTLSMGIAVAHPGQLKDPQDLIRRADVAMYESKREGRATITSYRDVRAA
jgi:diguanylate cyclase (GGDEF)-like protein